MASHIGIMGLGTMGTALARNIASRGYKVSVWNRSHEKVTDFISKYGDQSFYGAEHIEDFVESLEKPRKIIMLVPAGAPTEEALQNVTRALEEGDCLMDGGNAHFKDTERFQAQLKEQGIIFLGCGVSGGEQGALYGPSLMPGGEREAYGHFEEILSKIAAEDFSGKACVAYMGKGGAGHYVKMVHNGIEYAEMQMLAEAYDLLTRIYKLPQEELIDIFQSWDRGPLDSFLTGITVEVLEKKEGEKPLLNLILDKAGQKGTGRWTSEESLALGAPTPALTEAVFARSLSALKELRLELAEKIVSTDLAPSLLLSDFVNDLEKALLLSRTLNFVQGLELLRLANQEYDYELNFPEIIRVWQGGCIIRCERLKDMHEALLQNESLLQSTWFQKTMQENLQNLRRIVSTAAARGIPLFVLGANLTYAEALRSAVLPARLIQGLRDRFGAHGFERVDQPGHFHAQW
ncbi:NADP-dependent phosphogluconate dehydrogenase [Candidatus Peregrinibacteria bacterium]|nr:MAG: NADP-dependent phosphogluconate dehydrogenase [Candidatus Peregrinibacteria bacterium]